MTRTLQHRLKYMLQRKSVTKVAGIVLQQLDCVVYVHCVVHISIFRTDSANALLTHYLKYGDT